MNKIFVYGTLKKGFYNHDRYGFNEKTKFLKDAILEGFKMHDLGSYPCIIPTNNKEDKVHGEIYEYLDKDCELAIKRMEEGAGYKEIKIKIDDINLKTFIYEKAPNEKIVQNGLWI